MPPARRSTLQETKLNDLVVRIHAQLAGTRERTTPSLRRLRRLQSRELQQLPATTVLRLASELIDFQGGCPRWFAYELVHHHAGAMLRLSAAWLDRLGRALSSWGDVDAFGCYLLGPAWRTGCVSDACITRWARSKDRWRRRAALVATVALNTAARGGDGDALRTLPVCALLAADRDDMVVKALSWALRALAVRKPRDVQQFLDLHGERLAARVQREVRNKLSCGLKNPRASSQRTQHRSSTRRR
jgi:3-methyladenine DNA glycosylase AlkD